MHESCPHCDPVSSTSILRHLLEETVHFRVVCDAHPITEGHLLIIPKEHLSCIGACRSEVFQEFLKLYERWKVWIEKTYGTVSTFEHGVIGQTVFHAHVHLLPYSGSIDAIVPEGMQQLKTIYDLQELRKHFSEKGHYLFLSIGTAMWIVDPSLATPRFFRDRFAAALGVPERGNWKTMLKDAQLMQAAEQEICRSKGRL